MVDVVRYIVLVEFLFIFGFLLGILLHAPPSGVTRIEHYGFGTSYIFLLALGAAEVQIRLGHGFTWHTIVAALAGTVGMVAMFFVYRESTKRERR
jgi:energy-converting hydrogenase Eha subunit A